MRAGHERSRETPCARVVSGAGPRAGTKSVTRSPVRAGAGPGARAGDGQGRHAAAGGRAILATEAFGRQAAPGIVAADAARAIAIVKPLLPGRRWRRPGGGSGGAGPPLVRINTIRKGSAAPKDSVPKWTGRVIDRVVGRTSATMAGFVLSFGLAGAAGGDAAVLEEYRRANVLAEEEVGPVAPEVRQAHLAALAAYDEAVASRDPKHPGFAAAREAWEPLAAGGDPASTYHLGMLHMFGLGGASFDQLEAVRLIEAAAERRHPPAQSFMGLLAERGQGMMVATDEELALAWYTHGARGGHCAAVRRLVRVYREGELGAAPDAEAADGWRARLDGCRKR